MDIKIKIYHILKAYISYEHNSGITNLKFRKFVYLFSTRNTSAHVLNHNAINLLFQHSRKNSCFLRNMNQTHRIPKMKLKNVYYKQNSIKCTVKIVKF